MTSPSDRPDFIPFESFEIGQSHSFGAYEVTEAEIVEFARKYDPQFFHLDRQAATQSLFGGLCASGWHTCAMTMAMLVEDMDRRGRGLGSPGIDKLRWRRPVFPGDVLSVRVEVLDLQNLKTRPEIGIVVSQVSVCNQDNTVVMEFISNGMFPRQNPVA